jgi:hypothetical protein
MNIKNIEKTLKDAKFCHLTEENLIAYRDQKLDTTLQTLAESHLQLCLICQKRLQLFEEERAALENYEVPPDEIALIRHVLQQTNVQSHKASKSELSTNDKKIKTGLLAYLRDATLNWQAHFMQMKVLPGNPRVTGEVWRWQSEDKVLTARANLQRDSTLVFQLSSGDLSFAGVRLSISLGLQHRITTLRRVSKLKLRAQVEIPESQHLGNLTDLSIEIL